MPAVAMASLEKKVTRYRERNEVERQNFQRTLAQFNDDQLVSAMSYTVSMMTYPVNASYRLSVIAAYSSHRLYAPFRIESYTDSHVFNLWLEHCLLPELKSGQVVIMDSARFHQSSKTRELIESARMSITFSACLLT